MAHNSEQLTFAIIGCEFPFLVKQTVATPHPSKCHLHSRMSSVLCLDVLDLLVELNP